MPVAVLVLVLAAFAYVMVTEPRLRLSGLILGAIVAAGLTWYFLTIPSEQERAARRIGPADIRLDLVDLESTPRGAVLRGRVENLSKTARLRELTIALTLHDCPTAETELEACATIAQARAIARVDVPPGQLRGFSASYLLTDQPPLIGVLRWDYALEATRATQ